MTTSSSFCFDNFEYDVFLSFRGADIRNNFLSHLYEALKNKGINAFKDDKELERGKSIEPSLFEAIEKSKIALVVFSPNYTSSSWCLDELIEIVRCRDIKNQVVLPIFFKVDPSDIQEQTRTVAKAFEEYERNVENDKVQTWRNALSTVATISGWNIESFDGSEADLVKCVVDNIWDRLICDGLYFEGELVGIGAHMKEMDKLLNFKCNDVRIVGIWGVGGIGKTTVADFVLHKYFNEFDACYRLECKQKRPIALQEEFISKYLREDHMNIWNVNFGYNVIRKGLRNKKVLLMLDDIDDPEQLTVLANVQLFGQGSRIIVTTRDEHLFAPYEEKHIYEVPLLEKDQALQLFSVHAFGKNQPPNDFLELSKNFVSYAHGLPLVLKVLGAHLCGRSDRVFWCSEFDKLKVIPNTKIYKVLKISFDGLDDDLVKEAFLDIAFFFIGQNKVLVEKILYQCGFHPVRAFTILKDKALLTIKNGGLYMHEIIQGMGCEIVREESKNNANERSRLCDPSDVCNVLTNGKRSEKIEGISLSMSKTKALVLDPDTFTRMPNLRILKFKARIQLPRGLSSLPDVRYISWDGFPGKSLPSTFLGKNLVALELRESEVKHLWITDPDLMNLVSIDLRDSKYLKTLPSLSTAIRIERIDLEGCESLVRFSHDLQHLVSLEFLNLKGCTKFDKLPRLPPNLKELDLSKTAIKELPLDIHLLTKLTELFLRDCKNLSALPKFEVGALESLRDLWLEGSGIRELHESIVNLHKLSTLNLSNCTKLVRLPSCMHEFSSISVIDIGGCKSLYSLPGLPPSLSFLDASDCYSLETLSLNGLNGNLHLLNCLKLNTKTCSKVVKHCKMVLHSENYLKCVVPGNEIPDWFDYKSSKSSITIKSPQSLDQIKEIAFSVVVGPHHKYAKNSGDFNFDTANFHWIVECNHRCQIVNGRSLPCVDNVLVWTPFDPNEFKDLTLGSDFLFDFTLSLFDVTLSSDVPEMHHPLVIKKCGIHLITDVEAISVVPSSPDSEGTRKRKAQNHDEEDTPEESSKAKRRRFSIFSPFFNLIARQAKTFNFN